jgi:hypothetical protein
MIRQPRNTGKPASPGGALFLLVMFLGAPISFGMDWPAREGVPVTNFGWNNQGRPVLGSSFAVQGPIHAADAG